QKITKAFGPESFVEGKPNVPYLAEKVFSDPAKVKRINSIIHPVVIRKIDSLMKSLLKKHDLVFVEAALIYEASMEEMFDHVVLITASEDVRISRIQQRDKSSAEEIKNRMENQISDDIKKTHADFTFENNSRLEDLYAKADFLIILLGSMGSDK
ncbi:MAG: dephospho-CoA kinase, partial [Syntrophothermus sp.]